MLKHFETIEGNFLKKQNDYEESQVDTLTTSNVFVCVCVCVCVCSDYLCPIKTV